MLAPSSGLSRCLGQRQAVKLRLISLYISVRLTPCMGKQVNALFRSGSWVTDGMYWRINMVQKVFRVECYLKLDDGLYSWSSKFTLRVGKW